MESANITGVFKNGFWLMLPAFLLLFLLAEKLPTAFQPEIFWREIPRIISLPESLLRVVVFALPAFMVLRFKRGQPRVGWALYSLGTALYIASWMALIITPESMWSQSAAGFLAPAYTPLIWLIGVGLIGEQLYWPNLPYKPWMYIALVVVFLGFHITHAAIVFQRL